MRTLRRGLFGCGIWLACASCTGGQTGESPVEPVRLYIGGDGKCEAEACRGKKPSAKELDQFGATFRPSSTDYETFETVAEAIERPNFIATGWLVGVERGRREYNGDLCVHERPDDEAAPGECLRHEPDYSSYVNLVIEAEAVLRGKVPAPAQYLRVELPWPNNQPIDELEIGVGLGARVLILSTWVKNAREQAAPLADAGIDIGFIADNLLAAIPYGMALEDADGFAARQPFYGEHLALLVDPSGGPVRFDALLSAVEEALEPNP